MFSDRARDRDSQPLANSRLARGLHSVFRLTSHHRRVLGGVDGQRGKEVQEKKERPAAETIRGIKPPVVLVADTACSRQDLGVSVGDRKAWSCCFCDHLGWPFCPRLSVCGRRMPPIRKAEKGLSPVGACGCHAQGRPGSCQTEKQQATSLAGLPTLGAGVSGPLGRMQGAKARKGEKNRGSTPVLGNSSRTHASRRIDPGSHPKPVAPRQTGGHARKSLNSFFARRTAGCRVPAPSQDRRSCKSYAAGVAWDCMGRAAPRPVCSPTPSPIANWMGTPALPCSHQARGQLPGVGAAQRACSSCLWRRPPVLPTGPSRALD